MVWRAPATLGPWSTHTQKERGTERRDVRERKVRVEVNDDNRQPGGGSVCTDWALVFLHHHKVPFSKKPKLSESC